MSDYNVRFPRQSHPGLRMPKKQRLNDLEAAYEIVRSLRRILRKTTQHSRQLGRQSGLSVPQLLVLKAVADSDPTASLTAAEIAGKVHLSAPTITRLIDRLEEAKYVQRVRHATDRRKLRILLTDLGRQQLESLPTPLHEQFLGRLKKLTRAEKDNLLASLELICQMMDADELDASPVLTPEPDVKPQ